MDGYEIKAKDAQKKNHHRTFFKVGLAHHGIYIEL